MLAGTSAGDGVACRTADSGCYQPNGNVIDFPAGASTGYKLPYRAGDFYYDQFIGGANKLENEENKPKRILK